MLRQRLPYSRDHTVGRLTAVILMSEQETHGMLLLLQVGPVCPIGPVLLM